MNLKKYFFNKTKHTGETIIEILVAILILSTILISAFTMLNRSIDANVNIKNRIIALNIAREGIESVRNLRDTNWLKYSGDRRGKWLCWDKNDGDPDHLNNCFSTGENISFEDDAFFTIDFSIENQRYYLVKEGPTAKLDLTQTQANQELLKLYQIPEGEVFAGRYTHETSDGGSVDYNATPFFRQIHIDIQNPFEEKAALPSFCDDDIDEPDCTKHRARITAFVQWREEGTVQSMTLESYIYDFYERDAY